MIRFSRVIKLLPLCWSVLLCFTIFLSYAIAVSLDHVYPMLPSISKTAAFQPQASIFSFMLSFVAFFAVVIIFLRYLQLDWLSKQGLDKLKEETVGQKLAGLNKVAVVFGVACIVGVSAVGSFRSNGMTEDFIMGKVHDAATALLMVSGVIYFMYQSVISYHVINISLNTYCMFVFRLTISVIMALTGAGYPVFKWLSYTYFDGDRAHWKPTDPGYALHVANCAGEWITILCMAMFIGSFHREFQAFSTDVSYISNDATTEKERIDYSPLPSADGENKSYS